MKKIIPLLFLLMSNFACGTAPSTSPLLTVNNVDLNKYLGRWYEIATYPQRFQKGLTNVSATYALKKGYVEVYNTALKGNEPKDIKGKAYVVKNSNNAKLKVQFFWPFKGDYWIIDLDTDYKWAVVSDPTRTTLWILSRTPQMDNGLYQSITESLGEKGYDLSKLVITDQSVNIKNTK